MKRYMVPVDSVKIALKKISKINTMRLTRLQDKIAFDLGYMNWKEFIFINKDTSALTWISINEFCNLSDKLSEDCNRDQKNQIFYILSKIFLIDYLCLKEVYGNISDKDYYILKNGIFSVKNVHIDNVIAIESPIILDMRSNDIDLKLRDMVSRCFFSVENDFIYIKSDNILPDFKEVMVQGLGMGLKHYILNYPYDESHIRTLCRLVFANYTIVFSGPSAFQYKESMEKYITYFREINNIKN